MSEHALTEVISSYIEQRANAKLEKFDKSASKKDVTEQKLADIKAARALEAEKYQPNRWLDDAAKRASQIKLVTHALKYTHTDAKGSSIHADLSATSESFLSTSSISNRQIDVVGNAAALDVAGLLKLETESGQKLYQCIEQANGEPFAPFANNEEQLAVWLDSFAQVFEDVDKSSHKLAKQTYFPVSGDYHLVSAMFASSLVHELYERIAHVRYRSEEDKQARDARRKEVYSSRNVVLYPNLAVQAFGGTKPQNVSQLNSAKHGKVFLLPSKPPTWRGELQLPIAKYAFWRGYQRRAYQTVNTMAKFLKGVKDYNNQKIRQTRQQFTDELIDKLFSCAGEIRSAKNKAGWSAASNISEAEKYWLDPFRDNEEFVVARDAANWNEDIALQFAVWLNRQLKRNGLNVADVELQQWSDDLQDELGRNVRGFEL